MKKVRFIIFSLIICLFLTGCIENYDDTNGIESYTLQTITDENIIKLDLPRSGLNRQELDIENALYSCEYSAECFNGVDRLYHFTNFINKTEFVVSIDYLNVKNGNYKLVVVNDDEIIYEFPLNIESEEFVFEDFTGSFSIHVAGEDAEFELSMSIYFRD